VPTFRSLVKPLSASCSPISTLRLLTVQSSLRSMRASSPYLSARDARSVPSSKGGNERSVGLRRLHPQRVNNMQTVASEEERLTLHFDIGRLPSFPSLSG
jgi:hypothetical protein